MERLEEIVFSEDKMFQKQKGNPRTGAQRLWQVDQQNKEEKK